MSEWPVWSQVDDDTSDLLSILADDGTVSAEREWRDFVACLKTCADPFSLDRGRIDPNALRYMVRGHIKPARIGAFTRRAVLAGLVEYTGNWIISDDTEGKNAGKPCRELRWIA